MEFFKNLKAKLSRKKASKDNKTSGSF